ncbi:cytochrome P450 family protein [Ceratobasidium sp. AG-Ba]|nr:cytochrome P450 family protein [Ceratobasidium sp. AG-Ba]
MNSNQLIPGAVALTLSAAIYLWRRSQHSVPLPPGPKGNPIFGSLLDGRYKIARSDAYWLKFAEYTDQYGPLVSVRMLHERIFLVSDPELISELFEKRAANYSDRDISEMGKLIGWDQEIIFLNYGPLLKRFRTMLHRALNNRVSLDYVALQRYETTRLMRRLVDQPDGFMGHIHLMAASIAIRIAYGYKVDSAEDPFVISAEESMAAFSDVSAPGRWVVNALPILRHVPSWVPFATFKRRAEQVRLIDEAAQNEPFEYVLKQMAEGTAEDSFTSKLLQSEDGQPVDDETKKLVKNIAGSLYGAGSDTTVSGVQSFFLAMTLYPEVQKKAQAEIMAYMRQRSTSDALSRMILPADRPNLPYTSALVREVLRWHPIVAVVPHRSSSQDDCNVVSRGKVYRIPAKSVVMAHVWRIMHDPEMYPEPERFNPERYLVDNPPPEPENYAFGFGRRACPGIHIAQQSMWMSISNILANFTINKARDEHGKEITPEEKYFAGVISHPMPFKCSILPRKGCEEWLQELDE